MKKILFFIFAAAFALVGCEKVTETYADAALQLEVTSNYVTFGADGGSKTVLVTTNADWTYSASDSWYDVTEGDGALVISADANTTGANRSSTVTVLAADLSETISVTQAMSSFEDLSADGTANCYIASTGGAYRFNATVRGNGQAAGSESIAAYTAKYGTTIDPGDIVYADLLWEAVPDADKTRSREIIDGSPVYSDGHVYFSTGSVEGNAVIAVKDAQGTVLWSWHIWVTDSEIGETTGNGYHWQDRNLGAINNDPLDVGNRGLLYQWGRKDPFPASTAAYEAADPDVSGYEAGDGTDKWNYTDFYVKYQTEAPGNIEYSVRNPMKMLLVVDGFDSWYLSGDSADENDSHLWGDSSDLSTYVKSPFDPCPPGYNVPVDSAWNFDDMTDKWEISEDDCGFYWTAGSNAFYPAAGGIRSTSGVMCLTSSYGNYWTSGLHADSYYPTDLCLMPDNCASGYTGPAYAFSVRCMRAE